MTSSAAVAFWALGSWGLFGCGAGDAVKQAEPSATLGLGGATMDSAAVGEALDLWGAHHAALQFSKRATENEGGQPSAWRRPHSARLWRRLYRTFCETPASQDNEPQALCQVPVENSLMVDALVLETLFSRPAQQVWGGAFLDMTSLALAGIMERVSATVELHDLAEEVGITPARRHSELEQVVNIIAAIPDPVALAQAIAEGNRVRESWMRGFQAVLVNHRRLRIAVQAMTNQDAYMSSWLDVDNFPAASPQQNLAALFLRARSWQASETATQRFVRSALPEIAGGLEDSRLDFWLTEATGKIAALDQQVSAYRERRRELLQLARQNLHSDQVSNQIQSRLERIGQEARDIGQKSDDLGQAINEQQQSVVDFENAFHSTAGATGLGTMRRLRRGREQVFSLSAGDVPNGLPGDPLSYTVGDPMNVRTGDWIEVSAYGEWMATHALRIVDPKLAPSLTGPAGFGIILSESNFEGASKGHSDNVYSGGSSSEERHRAVSIEGSAGFSFFGNGVTVRGSAGYRASDNSVRGYTRSDTHQRQAGNETRQGQSFRFPLCLPRTPFPNLPAGSLVLAQVRSGEIVSAGVVSGSYATRAQVDGTMHLIVNDASPRDEGSDTGHRISVRAAVSYSPVDIEAEINRAMGQTIALLAERLAASATSTALVDTRDEILARAAQYLAEKQVSHGELPDAWREFFFSWVAREYAQYERRVTLNELRKSLRLLEIDRQGLLEEARLIEDERGLTQTEAFWLQENFDIEYLKYGVGEATRFLAKTLVPYIKLTAPQLLADANDTSGHLAIARDKMLRLPAPGGPEEERKDFATNAEGLVRFGRYIIDTIRTQRALTPRVHGEVVRVVIPRDVSSMARRPMYAGRLVDPLRAEDFWRAISEERPASIIIQPGDLYTSNPISHSALGNRCELPIVRSMAMYFDTGSSLHFEAFNANQCTVDAEQSPRVTFVAASGNQDCIIREDIWRYSRLPILTGPRDRVLAEFKSWQGSAEHPQPVCGATPFSRWTLDFSHTTPELTEVLDEAKAVVLIFSLEVRPCATTVDVSL